MLGNQILRTSLVHSRAPNHRYTNVLALGSGGESPDRQELESDQRILFSGRALSSKYRSALSGVMACGLRTSLEGATCERPDPRRAAGVGGPHSPARAPARLAAPFRGFAS